MNCRIYVFVDICVAIVKFYFLNCELSRYDLSFFLVVYKLETVFSSVMRVWEDVPLSCLEMPCITVIQGISRQHTPGHLLLPIRSTENQYYGTLEE
jgi:hypothetical protein